MAQNIADFTIDIRIDGQPSCCRRLCDAGWRFEYCNETKFVSAVHPLGGKQSVVEVCQISRTGFEHKEIGEQIAMLLNGGNHQ